MSILLNSRKEFVAALSADWPIAYPSNPVYFQNGPSVDPASEGDLSLTVYWQYNSADLGNIGNNANMGYQYRGDILLEVSVPEGSGMNKTLEVLDYLIDLLKARSFTSFFVGAPVPLDPIARNGRCLTALRVPVTSHVA